MYICQQTNTKIMSEINENIFGNRLKSARKMAGLSLQQLSDGLKNKVSKQALNKYEMGAMNPTTEVLISISKFLKIKPDYFFKPVHTDLGEISFRKKASLSKKDEESIIEKSRDYIERYIEIEQILTLENEFENPIESILINEKGDVENAANELRLKWELGTNPITNIVEMLELKGIKIYLFDDSDDIDGFSAYTSKGIPVITVNKRNKSIERLRFTIMHELAHLLLVFDEEVKSDNKLIEKLCHFFSSCFLIPTKMVHKLIGSSNRSYINIKELIAVKEYYGISIRALVHRLNGLKIITDNYYKRWVIYMNKTYGAKSEPGSYLGQEKSILFEQLINRALSEGIISLSKAATLFNVNTNELRKLSISAN